jgi:hypothetical protein
MSPALAPNWKLRIVVIWWKVWREKVRSRVTFDMMVILVTVPIDPISILFCPTQSTPSKTKAKRNVARLD